MLEKYKIPYGQLSFAPMEGVTDAPYRLSISELYPEWDSLSTDFLRAPANGRYSERHVKEHYGEYFLDDAKATLKNVFQILATPETQNFELIQQIQALNIPRLDLNLGCPSKTVNNHGGGAILLSTPLELKNLLKSIRSQFHGHFSVKIRLGFRNTLQFTHNIKMIEDEGIDSITIHARTRDQLYTGIADWNFIKMATETVKIPIIGNGDIWQPEDIDRILTSTGCHAIMCGRGALKTPWLARSYKELKSGIKLNKEEKLIERRQEILKYFLKLKDNYGPYYNGPDNNAKMLKRFKALCRYLFEDFENGELIRSQFLLAPTLEEFNSKLELFSSNQLSLKKIGN